MLGGISTKTTGIVWQTPFEQVPEQGRLQPPQFALLVIVSMQAFPHSICPAAEQPHVPPLQTEPAGHAMPQPPQFSALFIVLTHAPAEHWVSPEPQLDVQAFPLQTWPDPHLLLQLPQLFASAGMQLPLQESRPALHRHWPA
jgi:hypothetical protein